MNRGEREDFLAAIPALEANAAWKQFKTRLDALAKMAAASHEDAEKTAEQRAEHLWAMKHLRELSGWLASEKARNAAILKTQQAI